MENKFDRAKHVYSNAYTVVGFYPETEQRFCEMLYAMSPVAAEQKCLKKYPGVAVCATFDGRATPVDKEIYVIF